MLLGDSGVQPGVSVRTFLRSARAGFYTPLDVIGGAPTLVPYPTAPPDGAVARESSPRPASPPRLWDFSREGHTMNIGARVVMCVVLVVSVIIGLGLADAQESNPPTFTKGKFAVPVNVTLSQRSGPRGGTPTPRSNATRRGGREGTIRIRCTLSSPSSPGGWNFSWPASALWSNRAMSSSTLHILCTWPETYTMARAR